MRQLLVLSGKGGTGKTTVATAFIRLSEAKAFADCDVDAPNLHLLMRLSGEVTERDYFGMDKAIIDADICARCGSCMDHCRFGAIKFDDGYTVDQFACEGCGVCIRVCAYEAVKLCPDKAGDLRLYTGDSVFSTAQLKMGRGTSGMLVTEVKRNLAANAKSAPFAIIDGSPGIGCPVIASISGVDLVMVVAEPSLSGISDMKRIIKTTSAFGVPIAVCINKYDTNLRHTESIEALCRDLGLELVGRIPFDSEVVRLINEGQSIVDHDCPSGKAVREVYERTMAIFNAL
ncbi:MAG TPA: ATP-binding protein [Bacillota bacterium]|nr:ATP-binding protein [Bacillota bacterium]